MPEINKETKIVHSPFMDKNFQIALQHVLKWEGGFSDHPNDRGGKTNYGITESTYNNWRKRKNLPVKDIRNITKQEAIDIYYHDYWKASGADKLPASFGVAMFDVAVNSGVGTAKSLYKTSKGNLANFLAMRESQYKRYAQSPGQSVFLKGWLNRLDSLKKFVNDLEKHEKNN